MTLSTRAIFYIFAVIFIEGYIVLSTELLAIRIITPYVGSGTDTVSIIIAAVLLPLAAGYYFGGQFKPSLKGKEYNKTIRRKLAYNVLISAVIILFGLSFFSSAIFIQSTITNLSPDRLFVTTLYALVFLITPVFLLGQTTPLLSNFFTKEKLAETTGKILFISTLGSFVGATLTTLVLMSYIGVHYTVTINIILAAFLFISLSKSSSREKTLFYAACLIIGAYTLNAQRILDIFDIVENNKYNNIAVIEDKESGTKMLLLNNSISSGIDKDGKPYEYVRYIEDHFINTIPPERQPAQILVLGAGGFTLGLNDTINSYDFVDIDGSLKDVSEKYFLNKKLGGNKHFYPMPARGFLTNNTKKYDLILIDVFFGLHNIPEHLVTREFFKQVRDALKPDGFMTANVIANSVFQDDFSRNLDQTFREVFPQTSRSVTNTNFSPWNSNEVSNIVYFAPNPVTQTTPHIYTDNLNRSYADRPRNIKQ
ncbi:MAG: fused MFS/spermidine synthase [Alphaproteobacteria bacterium]|jgi:spermidine synthase|nr:fused MFS/spermidine synthase [Alphaproteobacteria bacterium]MCB9985123.1 fused MFS/spermidine synthase [Micavibrio sp.]HPQ50067.1 fused MFS/spermidine synthase [Alphaproteobacteria bacterium]HRK97504.1 fused MFS/spermidine synthase [Alphaproteobacteria bacterium]